MTQALLERLEDRLFLSGDVAASQEVIGHFGDIPGVGIIKKLELQDNQGNMVKFSVVKGGYGKVVSHDGVWKVEMVGTNANSVLKITSKQFTTIGGIVTTGPLKSINAAKVIVANGDIVIGNAHQASSISIKLAKAVDVNLNAANGYISNLKVLEWKDSAYSEKESIFAHSIKNFTVSGNKKMGIFGNLGADILLQSGGVSLNKLKVAGEIRGSLITNGSVKGVLFGAWNSGEIHADWIGSIKGKFNLPSGNHGGMLANMYLSGENAPKGITLKNMSNSGQFGDIMIESGVIGNLAFGTWQDSNLSADVVGKIVVKYSKKHWGMDGSIYNVTANIDGLADPKASSLKVLKAADLIKDSTFNIGGNVNVVSAKAVLNSKILLSSTETLTSSKADYSKPSFLKNLSLKGTMVGSTFTYYDQMVLSAWTVNKISIKKTQGVTDGQIQCVESIKIPDAVVVSNV